MKQWNKKDSGLEPAVSVSKKHPVKDCAKSLPPSRGKVARPQAVTDEGAVRLVPLIEKNCLPAPPPHPPQCAHWGTFPPEGGRLCPAGDEGFSII